MSDKQIIIRGSTASIGTQTIEVVEHLNRLHDRGEHAARYRVVGLAAGRNAGLLCEQAARLGVSELAIGESGSHASLPGATIRRGPEAAERLVCEVECDIVLAAMVGFAGLPATLAAVQLGRDVALANKETLVAAVHWAFGDMQLIGGSAGDGLAFRQTTLIHDGRVYSRSAILMMVESDYPFRVFKTSNFEPTQIKLVVTAADTECRTVYELNAEPAAREYASAIGLLPDELGPFSFASYPLVVKVGGDYYCRSIRNMNPDGSLSFFCAIDEGLVFTVARPKDMLRSTELTLKEIDRSLGGIDLVLGFDCVLRRLDAENRQIRRQMEDLYRNFGVVGFHTYGEQHNSMHLNQTLTGVAFGSRRGGR